MARKVCLITMGLALIAGSGCGCFRSPEPAAPMVRRAPGPIADPHVARAGNGATYPAYPVPEAGRLETGANSAKPAPESTPDRRSEWGRDAQLAAPETPKIEPPQMADTAFPPAKPSVGHPLVAALQCRIDKRPEEARRLLEEYDPAAHDLLFGLLGLVARFTEPPPCKSKSPDDGEIIDHLSALVEPLRPRAPLRIEKICFCNRIKTFGVFEPMSERIQFRPDDHVQVYVELRNFATVERRLPKGEIRHVINLRSSYEIQDENRKTVYEDMFLRDRDAADESRTPRHDYFENYVFTLPKLKPGFYTVWIKIEDLGTDPPRLVKGSLDFHVPNTPAQVTRGND